MSRFIDEVRKLLREGGGLNALGDCSEHKLVRTLTMLVHDVEDIVRQRACAELGKIVSRKAPSRIENTIRRLLWRLNPESGDYPVGVPELLGEIGNRSPQQVSNLVSVMLQYLDDETLRPGLLQAAGRIGQSLPDTVYPHIDEISVCLQSEDAVVAGNAVLALCRVQGGRTEVALRAIENDTREVTVFCEGEFHVKKLGELAGQGYEQIEGLCFIAGRSRT